MSAEPVTNAPEANPTETLAAEPVAETPVVQESTPAGLR